MSNEKENVVLSNVEKSLKSKQDFIKKLGGGKEPVVLHNDNGVTQVETPPIETKAVPVVEPVVEPKAEPVVEPTATPIAQEPIVEEKPTKKVVKVKTPLGEREVKIGTDEPVKIEISENKFFVYDKKSGLNIL